MSVTSIHLHDAADGRSPMNLVTGLWGMNVHVPGQDISEGVSVPNLQKFELTGAVCVVWRDPGMSRGLCAIGSMGYGKL